MLVPGPACLPAAGAVTVAHAPGWTRRVLHPFPSVCMHLRVHLHALFWHYCRTLQCCTSFAGRAYTQQFCAVWNVSCIDTAADVVECMEGPAPCPQGGCGLDERGRRRQLVSGAALSALWRECKSCKVVVLSLKSVVQLPRMDALSSAGGDGHGPHKERKGGRGQELGQEEG